MQPVESTELARALASMSAVLLSEESIATTVRLVTTLAARTIPGSVGAGASLIGAGGRRTTAASDPLVEEADRLQYELDSGPCLTAWRDRSVVRVDDVGREKRWPQWTAAVARLHIRAVLSAPMMVGGGSIGAIKVYSDAPAAFDDESEEVLTLFAQQAAILLSNSQSLQDAEQLTDQLRTALTSRDVIGQAKGVLIAQGAPDENAAFAMLVAASQRSNVKVHELARRIVDAAAARQRPRRRPDPSAS